MVQSLHCTVIKNLTKRSKTLLSHLTLRDQLQRSLKQNYHPSARCYWENQGVRGSSRSPGEAREEDGRKSANALLAGIPVGFNVVSPALFQTPSPWKNIRKVPVGIALPSYAKSRRGLVGMPKMQTGLQDPDRIVGTRTACRLARRTLDYAATQVEPGRTTEELDKLVFHFIVQHGAYPSPLMYRNYPKSICTSVNNVACHGIPDSRQLQDGDIVNVDVSVYIGGFHGDCSATFAVGDVDAEARHLMQTTQQAVMEAIKICRNGTKLSDIGATIESFAEDAGYSVLPQFCGHGIGTEFHMKPAIVHVAHVDESGATMETGMIFTIEPILSEGCEEVEFLEDKWTAVSKDNSRSAQFEETILVKENEAEILTVL